MASGFKLQVRGPDNKRHVLDAVNADSSLSDLLEKISPLVDIPSSQISILMGFPPKEVPLADSSASLSSVGMKNGESLTVKKSGERAEMKQGHSDAGGVFSVSKDGSMKVKSMPADNSCLFHAAALLLKKGSVGQQDMRELVAAEVARDPNTYTTLLLGSPNKTYQASIKNPAIWGGALELGIFAQLFKTEIVAFDVQACIEHVFGSGKGYPHRVFLLYNGKHYDAMGYQSTMSAKEQLVFTSKDQIAWDKARALVESMFRSANPSAPKKVW